jgi:uncharacterized protein YndB with AHSA1/START domain
MALSNERTGADMNDDARSISGTRVFDAPRELVFDLFTNAEHISNWWGPRGFTTTTSKMDLRPGGEWIFVMHGPDGTDYDNHVHYRQVVRPSLLTYRHEPVGFDVTVTFEERDGKTAVTLRSVFESAEIKQQVAEEYGAIEGLHQTLERLGEQVANANAFTIERVFDAPRELMFTVWTEAAHLQQWFGPKGVELFHCTNDLRPGGVMHYGMRTPDGGTMWGRWTYREIVPPRKLVFVLSFSDENHGLTRAPFDETWPLEMLATITFSDEGAGKTRVTVQKAAINASEEERRTFDTNHASMNGGWTGTFEQLEQYLKHIP